MASFKNFVWKNNQTNKIFTNLPIGMTEYNKEYKNIMENFETRNEFYINTLYNIDKTYLEEMDEWDPNSDISMFNKWTNDKRMVLKSKRELCEDFNKVMCRYMYCEYKMIEMKEQFNRRISFTNWIIILLLAISWLLLMYIINITNMYDTYTYDKVLYIGDSSNNSSEIEMENLLFLDG